MSAKEFLTEEPENTVKDTPENSAFACELCNKMYVHEDALAISMTCCGQQLKELHYEAVTP
jgi:hypothetical protein